MQTIEAIISLMFFMSASTFLMLSVEPNVIDDSLYRVHLAEDAWRILYLRGNLQDFGDGKRTAIESDLDAIGQETGLCYYIEGQRFTNCRGEETDQLIIASSRTIITDGAPERVAFSIYSRTG